MGRCYVAHALFGIIHQELYCIDSDIFYLVKIYVMLSKHVSFLLSANPRNITIGDENFVREEDGKAYAKYTLRGTVYNR